MCYTLTGGEGFILGLVKWSKCGALTRFDASTKFLDLRLPRGTIQSRAIIAEVIKKMIADSIKFATNIMYEDEQPSNVDDIVNSFMNLPGEEVPMEILKARIATMKGAKNKCAIVSRCAPQLLAMKKEHDSKLQFDSMKKSACDDKLMRLEDLGLLLDLRGWTFNVLDGIDKVLTVREWLYNGEYESLALVLHGVAMSGKTPCGGGGIMRFFGQTASLACLV